MGIRIGRVAIVVFILGFAQAAVASFCPLSSSKRSHRPPMPGPAYPAMAWVPARTVNQRVINGQPMVLVPVYPAVQAVPLMPVYYTYPR